MWTKPKIIMFLAGVLLTGVTPMTGQDSIQAGGLFNSNSLLELSLWFEMDSLMADLGEDPSYHKALLGYRDPDGGETHEIQARLRARGNFRKNPENCDFPPLKLKLDESETSGSLFDGIKEVKLVTHCQNSEREFEQYVLQEYLIYRLYNLFTEFSFRVRLARITYADLVSDSMKITRFAFLLEDADDIAERNQGERLELEKLSGNQLDRKYFSLMSVFNYMVLNTDYSVAVLHNLELISTDYFSPPIPVPYDFDWSGMINIPYDSPFADAKTRHVDRLYKGPCLKRKELDKIFSEIRAKRDSIYQIYLDFPYLDEELRTRNLQELDLFFITIGSRKLVRQEFIKDCED